ncbi:hypothetical protein [Pseudocolwellia sp. HL-MZ7]|uniref:hypothetical protein n=1 Tax=Pseudocolwellia sp. HL-MZ7 TaxID=3400627 RepID=UPI003CF4F5AF
MISLAILKESWSEASKQFSSQSMANDYLTIFRENNNKQISELNGQINNIDDVALSYLLFPKFNIPILVTALLVRNGISGEFIKTLSNIIPKDMLVTVLSISKKNLSYQYRRKSLNKSQTESVIGFIQIWSELMILFKNRSELVNQWLIKEKLPLCGNAPIALISTGPGREAISDMLYRIKTGDLS